MGNMHHHGILNDIKYEYKDRKMVIESLDAAIVNWGKATGMPTPFDHPDLINVWSCCDCWVRRRVLHSWSTTISGVWTTWCGIHSWKRTKTSSTDSLSQWIKIFVWNGLFCLWEWKKKRKFFDEMWEREIFVELLWKVIFVKYDCWECVVKRTRKDCVKNENFLLKERICCVKLTNCKENEKLTRNLDKKVTRKWQEQLMNV